MKNPTVKTASVTRHPRTLTQEERDRAAVKRHQDAQKAAHRVMRVIDDIARKEARVPSITNDILRNELPAFGPRTGTHPAAKTMDEVVEEILIVPRPPVDYPVSTPVIHAIARSANSYLALMGAACAFIAGIALGKAW